MDSRLTIGITRMYDKPSSASRQATIAEMDGNSKLTCSTNVIALAITAMASVYIYFSSLNLYKHNIINTVYSVKYC